MNASTKNEPIFSAEPIRPGFEELLQEYIAEIPTAANSLRDLVAAESERECEEQLHRLAGSLGLYGYRPTEQMCRTYLTRLRSGEPMGGMARGILEFADLLLTLQARPQKDIPA